MKTKTFILLCLLTCNLLPAQNVKLDITPIFWEYGQTHYFFRWTYR